MRDYDRQALDRYITGNYGEDQLRDGRDQILDTAERLEEWLRDIGDGILTEKECETVDQVIAWVKESADD